MPPSAAGNSIPLMAVTNPATSSACTVFFEGKSPSRVTSPDSESAGSRRRQSTNRDYSSALVCGRWGLVLSGFVSPASLARHRDRRRGRPLAQCPLRQLERAAIRRGRLLEQRRRLLQ